MTATSAGTPPSTSPRLSPRTGERDATTTGDDLTAAVLRLALRAVPGAGEASLTLVTGGRAHTVAATGRLARELDERQYRHGLGPCLEATEEETTVLAPDLTTDIRWYAWTAQALAAGARCVLSIGLTAGGRPLGALNIYARTPGALDDSADIAPVLAGLVAAALDPLSR
ncbi:GAF domain-containing protein [Actinoplanes sp. RD1]|uniref:GAF domain-containing protein n=1 Tax=Actinoplanes sp. RD1 TaxID=3064538 RepID=UPI00274122F0|nr:GAF domain-containing protein [Actinoplanes sp. RD1]